MASGEPSSVFTVLGCGAVGVALDVRSIVREYALLYHQASYLRHRMGMPWPWKTAPRVSRS